MRTSPPPAPRALWAAGRRVAAAPPLPATATRLPRRPWCLWAARAPSASYSSSEPWPHRCVHHLCSAHQGIHVPRSGPVHQSNHTPLNSFNPPPPPKLQRRLDRLQLGGIATSTSGSRPGTPGTPAAAGGLTPTFAASPPVAAWASPTKPRLPHQALQAATPIYVEAAAAPMDSTYRPSTGSSCGAAANFEPVFAAPVSPLIGSR